MAKGFKGWKFWLMWHKVRFDTGVGLTNYFKYFIAFYALASENIQGTIVAGIIYGIACYILGALYIKYKWKDIENEINNLLNPFQKEVRRKLGKKKV